MGDAPLERLKLLYDYEKFHIGLYGGMITGFIAILSLGSKESLGPWMVLALALAIVLLLIAAICGATLASSVIDIYANYGFWNSRPNKEANLKKFWTRKIGPRKREWWKPHVWWCIGHTAFWIAVLLVVGTSLGHLVYWRLTCQMPK